MADTARFDQFQIFMRKIGYSVGLEDTFARLRDLATVYLHEEQITLGDWQELVTKTWGLKTFHIGDVFGALGVIKASKTRLDILPGLDLLALSRFDLPDQQADKAQALALLTLIIEHDGEIFLNCLAADFEPEQVKARLHELIEYKRRKLFEMFRTPDVQVEIARIVGIERQAKNKGGGSPAKSLSEQRRREPLTNRTGSLSSPGIPTVEISDDYLKKVPPRRRDWAVSLELWDSKRGLLPNGDALFSALDQLGLRLPGGAVVVWPFEHEISRLRLSPTELEGRVIQFWDLVKLAIAGTGGKLGGDGPDALESTRSVLRAQIAEFRRLNRPKAMLRREYPYTVALPAISGNFVARGLPVPDLPDLLGPGKQLDAAFQFRSSRNSIGALMPRD